MANSWHETTAPSTWQSSQDTLHAHILQRREWGLFQEALGHKTFYASGSGWSWLAVYEKGRFGNRLYCPYGPTVTSLQALQAALQALQACAEVQHAMYIRIEPQGPLQEQDLLILGLQPAHRTIQPRYTWIKDLRPSEDELMREMSATNRNLHRTAGTKGLQFRSSTEPKDIAIFLAMMHEVAGRNDITIHEDQHYQIMAETLMPQKALKLYIAELQGEPVAASIVLDDPTTRYYAHAASFAAARKLHPGTPLVSHMIFEAKAQGQSAFDFYGIAPPDQPNHPWTGFTTFKQSFGGHIVDHHGTWELAVKKLPYLLYRTSIKLYGLR